MSCAECIQECLREIKKYGTIFNLCSYYFERKEGEAMHTGSVDLSSTGCNIGFERIRRITGYLVGTMDKWNDAKKAEESERVKHLGTGEGN